MSAYRSSAQHIRPTSLEELFGAGCDLEADDGLSLDYHRTPWKRHVASVRYRPVSLPRYLATLDREVRVDVVHADELETGPYRVVFEYGEALLRSVGVGAPPVTLEKLSGAVRARLRLGGVRCGLQEGGALVFSVTSYHREDLAPRFQQAYPWDALGLPPLVDRPWLVVKRELD